MDNRLPEGAANDYRALYNQPIDDADEEVFEAPRRTFAPGEAAREIGQAIERMEAAGMKPVLLNKTFDR